MQPTSRRGLGDRVDQNGLEPAEPAGPVAARAELRAAAELARAALLLLRRDPVAELSGRGAGPRRIREHVHA
jgi:hypothetical protein